MKKLIYIIIVLGCFSACTTEHVKPLIVQTDDFVGELAISAVVGDTIGTIPGTSTKGTVTYTINSQTPADIFSVDETYGELIVASDAVANLPINSMVVLEVSVSKEGVSQISNVEITVVPPPVDVTPWVGTVLVTQIDFFSGLPVTKEVPATDIDNGQLLLSGGDPFDLFCDENSEIIITFGQLTTATVGPVTISQPFICYGGTNLNIDGTGTYNTETKEILIDFNITGDFEFPGSRTITPKE
ncbi:cadherin repeat domain-containing protein [Flavivirga eckloniae]|uniref:Cadherin domain-containing protein n=1 Tax=Flavivirga eckloniae TaxID=1803846 RepID=A0A2K9PU74_9FLAO|nr:cadherin repeat domain-containing protein [Flavivirga eckloniae]AUP80604.1 hypothetical protein C1H87_18560 [Flavivirga eckloniae]